MPFILLRCTRYGFFYHFESFEKVCLASWYFRANHCILQIFVFVGLLSALYINFPSATMTYLALFSGHLLYFLISGMVFNHFERFERVCLSSVHLELFKVSSRLWFTWNFLSFELQGLPFWNWKRRLKRAILSFS